MKISKLISLLAALSALFAVQLSAGTTATTDPVGGIQMTMKASSDTHVGVPFHRPASFVGTVASVAANVITITGTPGWDDQNIAGDGDPKEFHNAAETASHYAIITSGTDAGMVLPISDNGTGTITVSPSTGDNLTNVTGGTTLKIVPFWTPATLFGGSVPDNSIVFMYDGGTPGTNLAASGAVISFGGSWFDLFFGTPADDILIYPNEGMIFQEAGGSDYAHTVAGNVLVDNSRTRLYTLNASDAQDLRFSIGGSVPEQLQNLSFPANDNDIIFGFDNTVAGQNKAATDGYIYFGGNWFDLFFGTPADTVELQPGVGYLYQKVSTGSAENLAWADQPDYVPGL